MDLRSILQNAPKGLRLYSNVLGYVRFDGIEADQIMVRSESDTGYCFDHKGRFQVQYGGDSNNGLCTLWPDKHCIDPEWQGWQKILFDYGDILAPINKNDHRFGIVGELHKVFLDDGQETIDSLLNYRYATPDERKKFWQSVSMNNLKWDDKTFKFISNSDKWKLKKNRIISGYWIDDYSRICSFEKHQVTAHNENTFSRVEYAVSCLAMAQLSQIIENDPRFGGMITSNEWNDALMHKYVIIREFNQITTSASIKLYNFLAFHTREQRDLFLEENRELIKNYLMIK